ncbi:YeiH family protein [Desulfurispora thermophila]|uniref:YeiH family protein n=1 Tax=Desulfurispora thermophila TaxID=265470 RepID=UPI00036C981F|nr:putative sulfate exporter family transporter [Desulfurispora thermophila]
MAQTQTERVQSQSLSTQITKAIPGLVLVLLVAIAAMWAEGYVKENFKKVYEIAHLNYVLLAIIFGMLIRNTVGVPAQLEPGLQYSTILTKTGIVVMGTKYTLTSLLKVGTTSMIFIAVTLFGTVALMFWLRKYFKMTDSLAGCLASGFSICGVSATVATGPAVKAKGQEMAYTIATILIFGLLALFTFPALGHLFGLNENQFGAWVGVGIVNSAQVLAAGMAYGQDAGLMAGIYNMGRVVLLPFVVLYVVMLVLRNDIKSAGEINKTQFIVDKFPVFIIAFLVAVLANTAGLFSKEEVKMANTFMTWAFTLGFASIGLTTKFSDMKAAGKDGIVLGFIVGFVKAAFALLVVKFVLPL